MKNKDYSVHIHIWINEGNNAFLGPGKINLLENIIKRGSIKNAAKEMRMAYRQAWQLVENMNKLAKEPLVEKIIGGKGGGGAKVTKAGENAIQIFHKLEDKIQVFLDKELETTKL